ncbi:putative cysteine-rich receptor-like protein kinase 9 [Humulus lupulus]|uniref:putative cysteine-rich receptor-like protein kinase 9 n=1 Tax=Humulus lupulus TaxID=3486 RepID=UPI002B4112EB|nr:putative cysteine-rich receptor-like protein kinase 9 [Humulus lupulus]
MAMAYTTPFILFYILLTITPSLAESECNEGATLCWNCPNTGSPSSATFKGNLKAILFSFSTLLKPQNDVVRYYNMTVGTKPDDQVTAIGLCRGDLIKDPKLCQSCLNDTATSVLEKCPTQKEAIIWAEKCMIRYSNDDSRFHIMENKEPPKVLKSPKKYTDVSAEKFKEGLESLLDKLIVNASSSVEKYASGSVNVTASRSIYSLVQCIPSMSQKECSDCLDESSSMIPDQCCGGVEGARVLKPSCTIRYESGIFYNVTDNTSSNTNYSFEPSKEIGEEKNSKDKTVIPVLSSVIGVVVLTILVHGFA